MQTDLEASHPDLPIQILGVNQWGKESGNDRATTGRDLPWLQDMDTNGDRESDVWTSWDVTWRDVIIVDANSEVVGTFNLTANDLRNTGTYDELKQLLIEAATPEPVSDDCNGDGGTDAADLACVSNIAERDVVLQTINALPGDLDGNGEVAFADFLVLSNNFGRDLDSYSDGNIDLKVGVDFADFLVLSNNFGATQPAELEVRSDSTSIDAAIGTWEPEEERESLFELEVE